MVCFTPLATSVAVIFAPATAAPIGSVMVPSRLPPSLAHKDHPSRPNSAIIPILTRYSPYLTLLRRSHSSADGLIMMRSPAFRVVDSGLHGASPKGCRGGLILTCYSVAFLILSALVAESPP